MWQRALKGGLPRVNWLVDLYNSVSVAHVLPVGGEDARRFIGPLRLIRAAGHEPFDTIRDGAAVTEQPAPGEVVWADEAGVTCRRWNWRQGTRTRLTEDSTEVLFLLERLEPLPLPALEAAGEDLVARLRARYPQAAFARRWLGSAGEAVPSRLMASLFALLAAVTYGAADFLGGIATRRATMVGAVLVTQGAGLALLLLATPLLPDAQVGRADLLFGALAGITGSIGVALLYLALAIGPMTVVAPVTAVCAAIVPLGIGLMLGERPHPLAGLGVVLALIAVALLSQAETAERVTGPRRLGRGVRVALASGVAIGLFLAALGQTTAGAVLWPLAISRSVSLTLFLGLALATGRPAGVPRAALPPALACGALDMVANALYLAAVRQGQLGLVATLASLYPASTVLLARIVLGERLGAWQQLGVAGAVAAIVLIVGNS